jgi:hypothetical protein
LGHEKPVLETAGVQMSGMQRNRIPGGKAARRTGPQNLSGTMREMRRQRVDYRTELSNGLPTNALVEVDNLTPIQPGIDVADRSAFRAFEMR